jgi:membrane protein implicated in regulation of membrane protease activity
MREAQALASACEQYWRDAGVPYRAAADMRQELEAHLAAALADGRTVSDVVGAHVATFAEAWAAEQRAQPGHPPSWREVADRRRRRLGRREMLVMTGVAAAVVIAAVVIAAIAGSTTESEGTMDNETWRWIWVGAAVFLAFAEIVTAGFFMLPFAAGAVLAAMLAWAGVSPIVQLLVFIGVSLVVLVGLQRFVRRTDEHQPTVGANRFIGQRAVVLEEIDRIAQTGRVKMDTELWRATTQGAPIPVGAEVEVVDVRGARLVVAPID